MALVGDNPIREPSEDRLGRAPLAASIAEQILHADAREGLVVGVLGPWGSGKTSFVNLVRHYLTSKSVPVLNFNPWLFSGSEHLVESFFSELTAHVRIGLGLDRIGKMLDEYGDHLSAVPLVGPWPARAKLLLRVTGFWQKPKKSRIEVTRDKIGKALKSQEHERPPLPHHPHPSPRTHGRHPSNLRSPSGQGGSTHDRPARTYRVQPRPQHSVRATRPRSAPLWICRGLPALRARRARPRPDPSKPPMDMS